LISGKKEIVIIQGDSYQKSVQILKCNHGEHEIIPHELIDKVIITSKSLNINKELAYDDENKKYLLNLTSSETASFKPQITNYDLTVIFTDSKIKTICYNGQVKILEKSNTLDE